MGSERSALIVGLESDLNDRVLKVLSTCAEPFHNVTIPNPNMAIDRAKHKTFDLVIFSEKNKTISGSFAIKKIQDIKHIKLPHHYILVAEDASIELVSPNITRISPQADEKEIASIVQKIIDSLKSTGDRVVKVPAPGVNVDFINPFIQATLQVLSTTCKVTCKKETAFIRGTDSMSGDISALIGMSSTKFKGSMAISFEKPTFLYILEQMLGEPAKDITAENQDAAAEICNQIFGMTKTILNNAGHDLKPAIPSVIVGPNHAIKHFSAGPVIAVRFSCEGGKFIVEAAVG